MALSLLGLAILSSAQSTATMSSDEFAGILSANTNEITSCKFIPNADGGHLVITMIKHGVGDAIHIEFDKGDASYNHIFSQTTAPKRRFDTTNDMLKSIDRIDIPLRSATGLRGAKAERIFVKSGSYSVFIGFGFRDSEEAEIYGACRVSIDGK